MKKLHRIEVVADRTAASRCDQGFLRIRRLTLRNHYEDGTLSREYPCDVVSRPNADAIAVVLWHREGRTIFVHLRECTRPAIYFRRTKTDLVQPDAREFRLIEELVAGVLEPTDSGQEGLRRRGSLEAHEEAGFRISSEEVKLLGTAYFASPGVTDEKVFLAHAQVDPAKQEAPVGDGGVMEEAGRTVVRELRAAILACRQGEVPDAKTELGLLRLAEAIRYIPQLDLFVDELPPELRSRWKPLL